VQERRGGPSSKPTAFVPPECRVVKHPRREVFASIAVRRFVAKLKRCASLSSSAGSSALVAVAAAGPPEADHYTAAAGEFVNSLEGSRFTSLRRKCCGATTGTGAGPPARDVLPVPRCWKASFRLNHESPSISSERALALIVIRTRRRAFFVPVVSVLESVLPAEPEVCLGWWPPLQWRAKGAFMNLEDGHTGSTSGSGISELEWLRAAAPGGACRGLGSRLRAERCRA
jgi:hypothetical protein